MKQNAFQIFLHAVETSSKLKAWLLATALAPALLLFMGVVVVRFLNDANPFPQYRLFRVEYFVGAAAVCALVCLIMVIQTYQHMHKQDGNIYLNR